MSSYQGCEKSHRDSRHTRTCLRLRRRRFRTQRRDFKESPSAGRKTIDDEDADPTDEDEDMTRGRSGTDRCEELHNRERGESHRFGA